MLHRIETTTNGVLVCPTMSFDEKGHRPNHKVYYVLGCKGDGTKPTSFYPTVESFIGEGGFYTHPQTLHEKLPAFPQALWLPDGKRWAPSVLKTLP